jgi:uncharacterized membrane protein HdeD (DUF308 family)
MCKTSQQAADKFALATSKAYCLLFLGLLFVITGGVTLVSSLTTSNPVEPVEYVIGLTFSVYGIAVIVLVLTAGWLRKHPTSTQETGAHHE